MKQPAFYVDLTACSGCKTCMIACMDGHDLPENVVWRRVAEYAGGDWAPQPNNCFDQNVFAYYISLSCNHCKKPICVQVCPTTAMHKDANGIVSVDPDKCVGCRYCEWHCPYSAPQYNPAIGKMSKCDFCKDRQDAGLKPLCVEACPMRAIDYGEYEDLRKKYGPQAHIAPMPDPALTEPCIFVRPPKNAQPVGSKLGMICNPEEM